MGVLLGGRLGYVLLYQTEHLLKDPFMLFRVWEGGMASHGGFIGVILATICYCKQSKQSFWPVADLIEKVVHHGLFFVRIANFINGELWGIPSKLPWAVLFPSSPGFSEGIARHPSQIYAALLEGFLLFGYIQLRFWKSDICQKAPGRLGGEFLLTYAIARIFGEIFREPDATLILGLSRGQFYSIFLFVGGLLIIYGANKRFKAGVSF